MQHTPTREDRRKYRHRHLNCQLYVCFFVYVIIYSDWAEIALYVSLPPTRSVQALPLRMPGARGARELVIGTGQQHRHRAERPACRRSRGDGGHRILLVRHRRRSAGRRLRDFADLGCRHQHDVGGDPRLLEGFVDMAASGESNVICNDGIGGNIGQGDRVARILGAVCIAAGVTALALG